MRWRAAAIALGVAGAAVFFGGRWTRPLPPDPGPGPGPAGTPAITAVAPGLWGDLEGRIVIAGPLPEMAQKTGTWGAGAGEPDAWIGHEGALRTFAWADGELVSVAADSAARWQAPGQVRTRYRLPEQGLNDGVLVPEGLAVAGVRGAVAVLTADGPRWMARGAHGAAATAVWWDGRQLYSGGGDGQVVAWDVATGARQRQWDAVVGVLVALVGTEGGVLAVGRAGLARCAEGPVERLATWTRPPTSAAGQGPWLAVGTETGVVELRRAATGALVAEWPTEGPVWAVAFDGDAVISGGAAGGRPHRHPLPAEVPQ